MEKANIISVVKEREAEANEAIAKLLRKAARYGCEGISITRVGEHVETVKVGDFGFERNVAVTYVDFEVKGGAPVVGKYEFLARIEFIDTLPLIQAVPSKDGEIDKRFRETDCHCDHCNVKRMRKDVFIVRNLETGEQSQVGRSCLRDFLGTDTPEHVLNRFKFFADLDVIRDSFSEYSPDTYFLCTTMALTVVAVKLFGWASRSMVAQAEERGESLKATSTYIYNCFRHISDVPMEYQWAVNSINTELHHNGKSAEYMAEAQKIIDWVRGLDEKALESDYMYNLSVMFKANTYKQKHLGLVVSAVGAYHRALELELRRTKEFAAMKDSSFVGEPKLRLKNVSVVLHSARIIGQDAFSGLTKWLVTLVTEDGNVLTWFTNSPICGREVGEKFSVDFTVKEHKVYKEIKQTVVTRVKEAK